MVILQAVPLLFKIVLAILILMCVCVCVCVHMKLKIALSISVKNCVATLMRIPLNLHIALGGWLLLQY